MFLKQIRPYLFIECINSQAVFCVGFLLFIPLWWSFYILISLIIRFTESEIHNFMTPKPFLQLECVMLIYGHIKSIYTNYMLHIKYSRYQIDNIHGAILLFLVDKSGDSNNHCFLNNNVSFHPITAKLDSLDSYWKFGFYDV